MAKDYEKLVGDTILGIVRTVKATDEIAGMAEIGDTGINCLWSLWVPTDGSGEKKFVELNFEVDAERCTIADHRGIAEIFYEAGMTDANKKIDLDDYGTVIDINEWSIDE